MHIHMCEIYGGNAAAGYAADDLFIFSAAKVRSIFVATKVSYDKDTEFF